MSNFSTGVETLVKRMETNPEEFFNEADKWRFIFKDKFREVLTEREKSAIHEGLTAVRRKEFDYNVMQTILNNEVQEQMKGAIGGAYTNTVTTGTGGYLTAGINTPSSFFLQEKEREKELETLKYNAKDRYSFK
jgi:hypothetical protein